MARQTDNLQLTLYAATDNPLVKEWRESLNLDNQDSAFSKIDAFAGSITTRVQTLEDKPDAVRVSATSEDGINYTATVSGFGTPVEGATIHLSVNTPNMGATALSINGVSTGLHKPIGENPDEGLEANDLVPGRIYTAIYHDTYWVLIGSMFPSEYSKSTHNHDDKYAELGHNHDLEYSPLDHEHEEYADKAHEHNNYVTTDTNQSITGIKQFEAYPTLPTSAPSGTNPISLTYANGAYLGIDAKASDSNKLNGQSASYYVNTGTTQTVGGVKTFSSLPVLPTTLPGTNNPIRKGYADANYVGLSGQQTVNGLKTLEFAPLISNTTNIGGDDMLIWRGLANDYYVRKSTTETIAGEKTFSTRPRSTGALPIFNKETCLATIDDATGIAIGYAFIPRNVSIYRTSAQSISKNSWTYVLWSTEEYDTDNMWSSGRNYITIPETAIYTVSASWYSATLASTPHIALTALFVDQTTPTAPLMTQTSYWHTSTGIGVAYNITSKFNSGQQLRLGVFQGASESVSISSTDHPSRFKVTKVSD